MTMLETRNFTHNDDQVEEINTRPKYTMNQVVRYVTEVQPRLLWENHLGRMALCHPNIVLGEE
jgi:ribosomal protein S17E